MPFEATLKSNCYIQKRNDGNRGQRRRGSGVPRRSPCQREQPTKIDCRDRQRYLPVTAKCLGRMLVSVASMSLMPARARKHAAQESHSRVHKKSGEEDKPGPNEFRTCLRGEERERPQCESQKSA